MFLEPRHEQLLIETLSALPGVNRVILFGSRARGDAEPRSDIDIAISAPDLDKRSWMQIVNAIEESNTLLKIDVIRYEEASQDLKNNIDREGVVLYDRDKDPTKSE